MRKIFINGFVEDEALDVGVGGARVRASLFAKILLWEGTTAANGEFAFELDADRTRRGGGVVVEVIKGDATLASTKLHWHDLDQRRGRHLCLKIRSRPTGPGPGAPPLKVSFPIGVLGADRPPEYRPSLKVPVEVPENIPAHPMAALPYLLAMSREDDPVGKDERSRTTTTAGTPAGPGDPP